MHKTPKLAQLGTPRHTQARLGARTPGRIVDRPGRVVAGPAGRVAALREQPAQPARCLASLARTPACARAPAALRAQCAPTPTACAPPGRIVAWLGTVSQYSPALPLLPSRNTPQCIAIQLQPLPSHNTVNCIAIQFSLLQPFCHNTLDCIAIQSKPTHQPLLQYTPVYCNPNSTLQAYFSAIQYSVLQYNFHYSFSSPLSCNTIARLAIQFFFSHNIIWAVAQKRLCTSNFFFFHYFQQLENYKKIYIPIFFSFSIIPK